MSVKKKTVQGIASKLPLAMKTGKYLIGYKQTIKSLISKKSKFIVLTSNYPSTKRRLIEYYAMLANNTPVCSFDGTNNDLSKVCDKFHRMGVLSILDDGEADLIPASE